MAAMNDLRLMHRPGTDDLNLAIAFTRAGHAEDFDLLLALARGITEDDDLLGVVVWLAQVAGAALKTDPDRADALLRALADGEAERFGR